MKFKVGSVVFGQTTTFSPEGERRITSTPQFLKEAVMHAQASAPQAVNYFVQLKVNDKPVQDKIRFVPAGPAGTGPAWTLNPDAAKTRLWWTPQLDGHLGDGRYTAELTYAGKTARVFADLKKEGVPTPPTIQTLSLTQDTLTLSWNSISQAKSYTVWLMEEDTSGLKPSDVKVIFRATSDVNQIKYRSTVGPLGNPSHNHYVAVIANSWNDSADDSKPFEENSSFSSGVGFAMTQARHNTELNRALLPEVVKLTGPAGTPITVNVPLVQVHADAPDLLYTARLEGTDQLTLQDPGKGRLKTATSVQLGIQNKCTTESHGEATLVLEHINDISKTEDRIPIRYHCTRSFAFEEQFSTLGTVGDIQSLAVSSKRNQILLSRNNALSQLTADLKPIKTHPLPVAGQGATQLQLNQDETQLLFQHNNDLYTLNLDSGVFTRLFALSQVSNQTIQGFGFTAGQKLWFIVKDAAVPGNSPYRFVVTDLAGNKVFEDSGWTYVMGSNTPKAYRLKIAGDELFPVVQEIQNFDPETGQMGTPTPLKDNLFPEFPHAGNLQVSPDGSKVAWRGANFTIDFFVFDANTLALKQGLVNTPDMLADFQLKFDTTNQLLISGSNGVMFRVNAVTGQIQDQSPVMEAEGRPLGTVLLNDRYVLWNKRLFTLTTDLKTIRTQEIFDGLQPSLKASGDLTQVSDGRSTVWVDQQGETRQHVHVESILPAVQPGNIVDFTTDRSKVISFDTTSMMVGWKDLLVPNVSETLGSQLDSLATHPVRNLLAYRSHSMEDFEHSEVVLRDLDSRTDLFRLKENGSPVGHLMSWSPGGQLLSFYSTTPTPQVKIYDLNQKKVVQSVDMQTPPWHLLWSTDSKLYIKMNQGLGPVLSRMYDLNTKTTLEVPHIPELVAVDASGTYGVTNDRMMVSLWTGEVIKPISERSCPPASSILWRTPTVLQVACGKNFVQIQIQ